MSKRRKPTVPTPVKKYWTQTTEAGPGDAQELLPLLPKVSYHSTFSSPEKFANYIESLDKHKAWQDAGWDNDEKFSGSKNMEESLEQARSGWAQGVDKIEAIRKRVQAKYPISKKPKRFGIAGAHPDVPRAVAGNVMNMFIPDDSRSRRRPVITLLCDMAALCYVSANEISNRAAVLAVLIDQIEAMGYSCEVISTALSKAHSKDGFTCATSIVAKRSDQPVDIGRLAFALGNAGMFRRMVFADWGSSPECRKLGSGLGGNYQPKPSEELAEKYIYVVPSCQDRRDVFETEELASEQGIKYLTHALQVQKCPPFRTSELEEKDFATPKWIERKGRKGLPWE